MPFPLSVIFHTIFLLMDVWQYAQIVRFCHQLALSDFIHVFATDETPENNVDTTKAWTPPKTVGRLRCSVRVGNLCFLQDTRHVAHVKSGMRKAHQELTT
jgi:hypothetical protein